jgi:8-oxo-dGTP diphosphatase
MNTERAAGAVDDTLSRLRERYGAFHIVDTEWVVDPETYDSTAERASAGTVGGAGAWVRRECDGETAALMVREADKGGWSEPAGKQEPGESLRAAACRETYEETGVECRLTGVLRAERAVHVVDDSGDSAERPPLPRLIVVFDAEYLRGEPTAQEAGIANAAWLTEHPDEVAYPGVADLPVE